MPVLFLQPNIEGIDENLLIALRKSFYIDIRGKVEGNTLTFNTNLIPTGNYTATIVLIHPSQKAIIFAPVSFSPRINITISDEYLNKHLDFVMQRASSINFTHYDILTINHSSLRTLPGKIVNLHYIETEYPRYKYIFEVSASKTMDDTIYIEARNESGILVYSDNKTIRLEAGVTKHVEFSIPAEFKGKKIEELNVTVYMDDPIPVLVVVGLWVLVGMGASIADHYYPEAGIVKCGLSIANPVAGISSSVTDVVIYFVSGERVEGVCGVATLGADEKVIEGLIKLGAKEPRAPFAKAAKGAGYFSSAAEGLEIFWEYYQKNSNKNGVSTSSEAKHYGCLNKPRYEGKFNSPSNVNKENALDANIQIHLTSPSGHDYEPFDTHVSVNGHKVGTIENTVPDGHYMFKCDPLVFNYAKDGVASNSIILDSPTMNRGYYISTSGVKVTFISTHVKIPVVAATQEEANAIVANMSGMMRNMPDFGIYPEDIKFSKTKPEENEEITINATVYNLGTADAGLVSVQLIDNNIPIENESISYLPAFEKETVSFTWSGSGGSHRISVKLNPYKTIEESDYMNNEAYKDISVTPKTDYTPPEISNVQASEITTNRATITWDTNELSNSLVKYGESSGNYTFSKSDSSYVVNHNITLTSLKDNTTYYYVVNSTDKSSNSAESGEHSFTTFPQDTTPPESVSGLNETDKGTTWILWNWIYPFEPDFSHTMVYINGTFKTNVSAPEHSYNATGLKPNTTYEMGTRTVDVSGNINMTWVNDTATTLALAPPEIISYAPESPVSDAENTTRTFNITVSQIVNVTWLINGIEVQTNISVTTASYTNRSAKEGIWNVSVIASNGNGTAMQSWIWQVSRNKPPIASFRYSPENPVVNEMVTFNASSSYDPDGNITSYEWDFGDGNTTNTTDEIINHSYPLAGDYIVNLTVTDDDGARNSTSKMIIVYPPTAGFDTGPGTYPSIMGRHTGTIKSNHTVIATKLYTYPCEGTGGHTEYAKIWNSTWNATAIWEGYVGDWKNITFDKTVLLLANETYNYTIRTGSYPQIHHTDALLTANGWINCTEFIDANGKRYNNWIPAIRLE